ncbi:MAG: adenosine deaminase family protein, partial [Candidatus Acidiferrales bacterium]
VYAEVTIALGMLLWRNQPAEPIFEAVWGVAQEFEARGLTLRWIPDGTWQFGAEAAMSAATIAAGLQHLGVIGFGMGGDEMALPYRDFRPVYDYVASHGLRRVAHAGEVGPPQHVRDAIELLGAERIGHGIAAIHDPALAEVLTSRRIALEVCPTSNICTGALAKQLAKARASLAEHPLKALFQAGVPLTLSTDDPAMFHTDLLSEYGNCASVFGFSAADMLRLAESSFAHSFLAPGQKAAFLQRFRASANRSALSSEF